MNTRRKQIVAALAVLAAVFAVAACGGAGKSTNSTASARPASAESTLPQGSEPVDLNPADFSTNIDNPYWPMSPGSRWVYSETDTTGT